jgi:N-acetylglucosamine malate deacetylase 1
MSTIVVIAPHPDDETLGCGGTLLRHKAQNDSIHWLIMTTMSEKGGYSSKKIKQRSLEIRAVANEYFFDSFYQAKFDSSRLDMVPKVDLINEIASFLNKIKPDTIYLPYRNDAHSDHKIVFDASAACTKSFRFPFLNKIRVYETLSETEFALSSGAREFHPNLFINISLFLEHKIKIMELYHGEIGEHPFPRSAINIRSLARLRGATSGCNYAESFMSLKEILY